MAYFKMSKLALKWAISKPKTQKYPLGPRRVIPKTRGQLVFVKDDCTYCTVCGKKCPTKAIEVIRAQKKWTLDRLRCISCNYCVEVCPKKCLELSTDHASPAVAKEREHH